MRDVRVDWYQSDNSVNVDIFCKNCDPNRQLISFEEKGLSINLRLADGDSFQRHFDLFSTIIPGNCSYNVGQVKISIQLKKKIFGERWKALEAASEVSETKPEYPSSSKSKHDWDKLEKELGQQKEDEKSIDAFFKGLYANASDETRKAMAKSFIESKGTVLSTNWNDVGSKKVEPSPPEGFEVQKI